jgi:hypothetical protein
MPVTSDTQLMLDTGTSGRWSRPLRVRPAVNLHLKETGAWLGWTNALIIQREESAQQYGLQSP